MDEAIPDSKGHAPSEESKENTQRPRRDPPQAEYSKHVTVLGMPNTLWMDDHQCLWALPSVLGRLAIHSTVRAHVQYAGSPMHRPMFYTTARGTRP